MTYLWSGSETGRVMACPSSAVLPKVKSTSPQASRGNAVHTYLQFVKRLGKDEALQKVPDEYRELCEGLDEASIPDDPHAIPELSLAFDVKTGIARELGRDLGRNYGHVSETEIPMTLDLVSASPNEDFVIVWDYKTGNAPTAKDDWQLRMGALAACRLNKRSSAKVAIAKVAGNGKIYFDWSELDAFDIDTTEAEIVSLFERVEGIKVFYESGATVSVSTGPHCKYCPALVHCPAQGKLIAQFASGEAKSLAAQLTPEIARLAKERLDQIRSVAQFVDDALQEYAKREPIPTKGGKVWGPMSYTTEELDPSKTFEVIARLCGPEAANTAVPRDASKAAIERGLKALVKSRGVVWTAFERELMEALRKAGAVTEKVKTRFMEYVPRALGQ